MAEVQLVALGQEPIDFQVLGMWWHWPDLEFYRPESMHGFHLARLAYRSHVFAGDQWSDGDEAFYAARLEAMSPSARERFRQHKPFSKILAKIASRPTG